MNIITIIDAKKRIGECIPGVTGIIQKVFERKTGQTVKDGKRFDWSLQNGEISDDTGIIKFTVFGADDFIHLRNQQVSFVSSQGKKGLEGVVVEEKSFVNKKGENVTNIQLTVSSKNHMIEGTPKQHFEEGVQEHPKDDAEQLKAFLSKESVAKRSMDEGFMPQTSKTSLTGSNASTATEARSERKTPPDRSGTPKKAIPEDRIKQYGELYSLCVKEVLGICSDFGSIDKDTDAVRTISTAFWIQSVRDGLLEQMKVEEVDEAF